MRVCAPTYRELVEVPSRAEVVTLYDGVSGSRASEGGLLL